MRVEFEGGFIEYHEPNLVEGLRMMAPIKADIFKEGSWVTSEELTASTIEHMGSVIDRVEFDGKEVEIEELLGEKKAHKAILKVADDLIACLFLDDEKKS